MISGITYTVSLDNIITKEVLKGDRAGLWSIRINDQWRICFGWHDGHAYEVGIVDYH